MRRATAAPSGTAPRRILAVQLRRLGDLILATPAFHALKTTWPGASLTVLTEQPFNEVLEGNPDVDEVMIHSRRGLATLGQGWKLSRRRFDLAIDFHGNPTSARLAAQSRARVRVGWAKPGRSLAYTVAVEVAAIDPPRYTGDQKLDLVRALAVHAGDARPRVYVSEADVAAVTPKLEAAGVDPEKPFVVAAPASRRAYKEWTPEKFAAALRIFRGETGAPLVLAGARHEEERVRRVADAGSTAGADAPAVLLLDSIREWVGLIERCRLYVGPDGGAKHIAQALDRSTLAIFGPQNPAVWTIPCSAVPHAVVSARRPGCDIGCAGRRIACECLTALEPAAVAEPLGRLWEEAIQPRETRP